MTQQRFSIRPCGGQASDKADGTPSRKVSHMRARSAGSATPSCCALREAEVPALMRHIGATFVAPRLPGGSWEDTNWAVLKEQGLVHRVV